MKILDYSLVSRVLYPGSVILLPFLMAQQSCSSGDADEDGWTIEEGDCNDEDNTTYPGAPTGCDGIDHNCDGLIDGDADQDGVSDIACGGADCADTDPAVQLCGTCLEVLDRGGSHGDGIYTLDPCADGVSESFFCDMTHDGGGWTLGGWQDASATTNLGITAWGDINGEQWSSNLSCVAYSQVMVFNRTFGEAYHQTYEPGVWSATSTNMAIGPAGKAFKQGTYGPSDSQIMMGCVDYAYNGGVYSEYACDNDSQRNQKGHLADYAGEYCSWGRLDYTWAWTDGTSCFYRGETYSWGIGLR